METRWIRLFDEEQKPRKFSVMWEEFLSPYGTAESVPPGVPVEFIGEPTANLSFNLLLIRLSTVDAHPVIRTVLPAGMERMWLGINDYINTINACYDGTRARIVYVLGSTSEKSRHKLVGHVAGIAELSKKVQDNLPALSHEGKMVLSFSSGFPLDIDKVRRLFSPDRYEIEITSPKDTPVLPLDDWDGIRDAGFMIYPSETEGEDAACNQSEGVEETYGKRTEDSLAG